MVNRYGNGPEPLIVSAGGVPYNKSVIDAKDVEIERLTACLRQANAQAEKFEREWYLRGDQVELLQCKLDESERGRATARDDDRIKRTCDRLESSDPQFDDCADAVHLLVALQMELQAQADWKSRAIEERQRRVAAESKLDEERQHSRDLSQLCASYKRQAERAEAMLGEWARVGQIGHPNPCTLGPLCPYCEIERLKSKLEKAEAANLGLVVRREEYDQAIELLVDAQEERDALQSKLDEILRGLKGPATAWANMLRGEIARPQALEHYEECKAELEKCVEALEERNALSSRLETCEGICSAAYQILGSLADDFGIFHHPAIQKALTMLSRRESADILPWPSASISEWQEGALGFDTSVVEKLEPPVIERAPEYRRESIGSEEFDVRGGQVGCKHAHQSWNIFMTKATCTDCGALLVPV